MAALLREVDLLPRKNCCWRFYWHVRQLTWQLQALEALLRHFLSDLHFMSLKKQASSILAGKFDGDTTSSATESSQSPSCLLSKVATGLSFCTLKRKQTFCLVKAFRISISWLFDPLFKPLKVNIGFSNRRSWGESPSFLATGTGWWIALNGLMLLFSYCECKGKNCRWFKMVTQISFPRVCFRAAAELVLPLWHAWVTFSFIKWRGS